MTSLHSTNQFDIIHTPLQMMLTHRLGWFHSLMTVALLFAQTVRFAAAEGIPAEAGAAEDGAEPGTTRTEIMHVMQDVQRKYGRDAVIMEGHLLQHAVRSGSVLATTVSVPGLEEHDGKHFLAFNVETGIIYNDREIPAPARPVRAWNDIVEATLRKFHELSVSADGIALTVAYGHKVYGDEADLRAHLSEGHGDSESAAFYLLLSDIRELLAEHISAQELVDRSTIFVNGTRTRMVLATPTPAAE